MTAMTMAQAWAMVEEVQRKHPGWRFSLLGGDVSMGYLRRKNGDYRRSGHGLMVDEASREGFGWWAEFHGHLDPRCNTGQRHASEWAATPQEAIRLACLNAREVSP